MEQQDGEVDRVQVSELDDVESNGHLAQREIETVMRLLNEGNGPVLAMEDWLCDKKNIRPVENERRIYQADLTGETAKAWKLVAGGKYDVVPKSQSVVFERAKEFDEITTSTTTLGEFERA